MRMDLAGERFQVEKGYEVWLPPGDHLIVVAGAHLGEPGYDFDHPNIAAKKSELFEFKHYRKGGSKFWTSKAGISFYFVIPKAQIELLPEKGYSYVPVLIHGRKCHLNVSGGTGNSGWTDCVRQGVDIGCGWTDRGPTVAGGDCPQSRRVPCPGNHPGDRAAQGLPTIGFHRSGCRRYDAASTGSWAAKCFLRDGWNYMGSQGPFAVESRPSRKRYFICACRTACLRIQYAAIDWTKTAEINGVAVPDPVLVNRIDPLLQPASI